MSGVSDWPLSLSQVADLYLFVLGAVHELCHQQTKERTIWKTDPLQFKTQLFWTWVSLTASKTCSC